MDPRDGEIDREDGSSLHLDQYRGIARTKSVTDMKIAGFTSRIIFYDLQHGKVHEALPMTRFLSGNCISLQ
jgi:hypothetical protein